MKNIAIIPARSGSKGLPDKNIMLLCGKPLMAYAIEAALQSDMFDTVHVSTDSERYAEIARQYGANVPFLRSLANSSDTASSLDTIREVLIRYNDLGHFYDTFMLLQPTSPLRTAGDICNAFTLMQEKQAKAIVSVCEADHPPIWYNTLPPDGSMRGFIREDANAKRRQDVDTYYRINGAIYLSEVKAFLACDNIYNNCCYAYIMPRERSIDIDAKEDMLMCESLLNSSEKQIMV